MSNIIKHIFSNKDNIPVFKEKGSKIVNGYLSKGEWMGLVKEFPDQVQIICTNFIGWVNREDCVEKGGHLNELHPEYMDGEIKYFLPI